jgi:hypothetical protein
VRTPLWAQNGHTWAQIRAISAYARVCQSAGQGRFWDCDQHREEGSNPSATATTVEALADNPADVYKAVPVQLVLSVFALTVATLTLVLAARRLLNLGSSLVFSRLIAVGGMVAFSSGRTEIVDAPQYYVRFEVGGSGVFHNVAVHLLGLTESPDREAAVPPKRRRTMSAGDDPIEWTFTVADGKSASDAWVMVSWVRLYLEGIDSEPLRSG